MRSTLLAAVLTALAILVLGACGGKTQEACGKTLLTGKICGDELVAWCQDRYDPTLNGDACTPALRDAGQDPDEVLAAIKATEKAKAADAAEQDRAAASDAEQDARVTVASGSPGELGDVTMTVTEPDYRQKVGNEYSTQRAKPGRRFAVLRVVIHNDGDEPLSACGFDSNARLLDSDGKLYSTDMEASTYEASGSACTDDIQPGDEMAVPVVFDLRDSVEPVAAAVWAPGLSTQPDDPHLLVQFDSDDEAGT